MRQSNNYIILYSAALTVVCALALAFASISLKDRQDANIAREKKINILSTVMTVDEEKMNIDKEYASRIRELVVDASGKPTNGMKVSDVNVASQYKESADKRLLPVYEVRSSADTSKLEFVVLPVYGYGLWNNIWGFVALRSDFNTIEGVKFQHAGETPGLGARIEAAEIQDRYKGKTIFEAGNLASVIMQKGELGNEVYANQPHAVDGMSGATLTGKGVNNMLKDYLGCYSKYLLNKQQPSNP